MCEKAVQKQELELETIKEARHTYTTAILTLYVFVNMWNGKVVLPLIFIATGLIVAFSGMRSRGDQFVSHYNPARVGARCCFIPEAVRVSIVRLCWLQQTFFVNVSSCRFAQKTDKTVPQPKIGVMTQEGPWPECIGKTGAECMRLIETAAPALRGNIFIVPKDSFVTMDFNTDRVRIFVNENGIVEKAPGRG